MVWRFFSALLVLAGFAGIGLYRDKHKRKKLDNARNRFRFWLAAGVLISAMILIYPVQQERLANANAKGMQAHFSSLIYAMQLFTLNVEYKELPFNEALFASGDCWASACAVLLTVEFVIAPLLTFAIVLSFFRNVTAWYRRLSGFLYDTYVFSELNEQSLVLAESIRKKDGKACLIFTDVNEDKEEELPEYRISRARKMKAACYKQDVLSVNLTLRNRKKDLNLYLIGDENKSENIVRAMELIDRFRDDSKCRLYIFSSRAECEFLLNKKEDKNSQNTPDGNSEKHITVRRINAVSCLINRTLNNSGCELLYDTAIEQDGIRKISAVLVGLGQHGTEMLKALTWYCRMDGYRLEINAFDKDPDARNKLAGACPGLFAENAPDKDRYRISIWPGLDVEDAGFTEKVKEIGNPTYALVALGSDELNIRTAAGLRAVCERNGCHPVIQAIVYNSKECRILDGINNHKHQKYDIDFIGDVTSSYTENVLINTELGKEAEQIHMEYAPAETLFDYEYNYRSSCASAIHAKAVAWQLMNIREGLLNTQLLKRIEFWFRLAYRVCDPAVQVKCTLDNGARGALEVWAEDMRAFAAGLPGMQDFSFQRWENRELLTPGQIEENSERIRKLLDEYGRFAEELSSLKGKPGDDLGLWRPFTREKLMENSEGKDGLNIADNPVDAVWHSLLVKKLMMLEHDRWIDYMYTIGYGYSENRNDLGKGHQDLVPYENLEEGEKGKDLHLDLLISQLSLLKTRKEAAEKAAQEKKKGKEEKEKKEAEREAELNAAKIKIEDLKEKARINAEKEDQNQAGSNGAGE